ncbi:hypothetical protein PMAYCL1PPCAC_03552, partial [Pristionchus mayeri]
LYSDPMMRSLLLSCLGFCSVFLLYGLFSTQIFTFDFAYIKEVSTDEELALFSTCVLAEFSRDGWTNEVLEKAWVDFNPVRKCDEYFVPFTILSPNGRLTMNRLRRGNEEVACKAR